MLLLIFLCNNVNNANSKVERNIKRRKKKYSVERQLICKDTKKIKNMQKLLKLMAIEDLCTCFDGVDRFRICWKYKKEYGLIMRYCFN